MVHAELRTVVIRDGPIIICVGLRQSLDSGDYFLGPNDQDNRLAIKGLRLPKTLQVLVGGLDGIFEALLSLPEAARRRLDLRVRLGHLGRYSVLKAEQIQDGNSVFRAALIHKRSIAESQVLQLPKDLNVKVTAGSEVAQVVVPAAAEVSSCQRRRVAAGVLGGAALMSPGRGPAGRLTQVGS
jgi:hypothetical protein